MRKLKWFNVSAPMWLLPVRWRHWVDAVVLWNLFNRVSVDGHWWGVGVLQLGHRHLAYVGHTGFCLGFVWLVGRAR